ncbi:MAG: hypothetical protein WA477_20895 [Candidatus Sulfotelmatobacter sp.]
MARLYPRECFLDPIGANDELSFPILNWAELERQARIELVGKG